jgi:DNA-binding transcriptional LysR family regulator
MDKLRAMTTFVRIVEAGSLTSAAELLGSSLTSVVRSLSGLEQTVGVRLLNRTTRRIALTDEGREYFERCRRLLAEIDEAEAALSARRMNPSGKIVITAPVMFGRLHVAPTVTTFLGAYPEMRAELFLLDRIVDLLEEGIDVAIRIGPLPDSSLVAIPLGSTRIVVCASPEFLGRHGVPALPADLARHSCIDFTGLSSNNDEWEFQHDGLAQRIRIQPILRTNQGDSALDACTSGLGCGRFLAYQPHKLLLSGKLVRVLKEYEPAPLPVNLVYPHSRLMSPRVRTFVDWAVPRLRELFVINAA